MCECAISALSGVSSPAASFNFRLSSILPAILAEATEHFEAIKLTAVDEIHYPPPKQPQYNVLGGAGSYSALGARLLSPSPTSSKQVGWIVDKGCDFPASLTSLISSWQTSALFRSDPSRLTTRGWNGYSDVTQYRDFKYTSPKLRLEAVDLLESPALLNSKAFHLICSPSRCVSLINNINSLRITHCSHAGGIPPKPLFIWEPVPDACVPNELLNVSKALGYVDICSPNHAELGQLMGCTGEDEKGNVDRDFVEEASEMLLSSMPLSSVAVVVRCGSEGCYIAQNAGRPKPKVLSNVTNGNGKAKKVKGGGLSLSKDVDFGSLLSDLSNRDDDESEEESDGPVQDYGLSVWIPAYHTDASKVVDPTGGGNAFLGGLGVSYARGYCLEEACRMGAVAASFAIEQVGMPSLSFKKSGEQSWDGGSTEEFWNGASVKRRLKVFESRCKGEPVQKVEDVKTGVEKLAFGAIEVEN